MKKIEFIASFPDILAIGIGGQVRNTRIKIDIPQSEMVAVVNLLALDGKKPFKITIEEIEEKASDYEFDKFDKKGTFFTGL